MSDFIPKPGSIKIGGLGPKAARLQALREKAAAQAEHAKTGRPTPSTNVKANSSAPARKPIFNRKAV